LPAVSSSSSSHSSSSPPSPFSSGTTFPDGTSGTSVPNVTLVAAKGSTPSLPVPVPTSTNLLDLSSSGYLTPPSALLHPSASAPPNLAPTSTSPSLWRRFTGGISKSDEESKTKKGFLSRKASDVLLRTKSRTA